VTELTSILDLDKPEVLINQLIDSGYAVAAWRLPHQSEYHLIVSLEDVGQLEELKIEELGQGFLINGYANNHPIKPHFLPADLIITNESLTVDPRVTSQQLDLLIDRLQAPAKEISKQYQVPSISTGDSFIGKVEEAVKEIQEGTFEKVVLSRYQDEQLPEDFNAWNFFQKITNSYPNAFCSLAFVPGYGIWIGATPELLLSNNADRFQTVSLAGTKSLQKDQNLNEIAWTQKEIEEQAFVSRYIINCFKRIRLREFYEHGPKTIQAGNLAHLKTEFQVLHSEVGFEGLAEQMLDLLHPTSAVCGMPIEQTKPWISTIENYDREFYSGFLGPVNFQSSTDLFVNLRCMKVDHDKIRFYAGAGITEDSTPMKELEETELKMNILKSLL